MNGGWCVGQAGKVNSGSFACFVVQAAKSSNGAKGCGSQGVSCCRGEGDGGGTFGGTLAFVAISEGKSQKVNKHQDGDPRLERR